jgi:hypothetical protein
MGWAEKSYGRRCRPDQAESVGSERQLGTQDVQGDFGIGEETVPEVVRKVRMGGKEDRDEMVFAWQSGIFWGRSGCSHGRL